jgi:hypothetical protein
MEVTMVSQRCDFAEFVESMKAKSYSEIIIAANREATLADRCLYRKDKCLAEDADCIRYAKQLKDLIYYFRYGTRPAGAAMQDIVLCKDLIGDKKDRVFQVSFRSRGHSVYYLPTSKLAT